MPVAKLSREFYERFGDKLTDELVNCLNAIEGSYRAESEPSCYERSAWAFMTDACKSYCGAESLILY